jgi:phosphoribosyl-AMP cyclohydrolase
MSRAFLDSLKYDENGLVSAIIQDAASGEVLMFAFTNRDALEKTLATGKMHFWSRSRKKLWLKGEESGHVQEVAEVRADCDRDALLIKVRQHGGACHTGYRSCFFTKLEGLDGGSVVEDGVKVFEPKDVYKK